MNHDTQIFTECVLARGLEQVLNARTRAFQQMQLEDLLVTTPAYALQFEHRSSAVELLTNLAHSSDSELATRLTGKLLRKLSLAVAGEDRECELPGIDIDLERDGIRYLISVKSDNSRENLMSRRKQLKNFQSALRISNQNRNAVRIQPTLGICYGNSKTVNKGSYLQIGGQSFWELISGEPDFYKDLIEPVGYCSRELNDELAKRKAEALTRMTRDFINKLCTPTGAIDWPKVVELVSKDM